MTKIYRIPTGQVEGNGSNDTNTSEIRPYGEIAVYVGDNNKLELLMFDGVRTHVKSKVLNKGTFYGGDADSADGAGYDSIKLVPDEELRRNGSQQYIIVEPTGGEPGHVHIRAGGTIDSSTADLFLGGELNNVRVSDTSNSVTISADANDNGATRSWIFDTNGILSVPAINNENLFIQGAEIGSTTSGIGITATNGITLTTDALGTPKFWQFDTNGTTTFPDDKIKCPISDNISIETEILPTAPPTTIVISGADFVAVNRTYIKDPYDPNWFPAGYTPGSDPLIQYSDGQWKILVPGFDQALYVNTGTINVPLAQWNTNPPLGSVAPTGVYTYADTYTRTWHFGSNGNLTLPNNSTISDTPAVAQYSSSFKMSSYGYNGGLNGYFTASPDTNPYFNPLINTVTPGWFVSGPGLIGVKEITAMLEEAPNNWAITVDLTDGSTWPFDERAYTFYSPDYQIVPAGSTLTVNGYEWKFGANSSLTFPDGSVYDHGTLTGAVDSDLEFVVKHRTTVSDVAAAGSTTGTLIVDISENDDITVVGDGWEINAGSEIAPIWMSVTETTIDPGNTYEIVVSEFVFEPGNTYTFRNPTPTSKVWTIGSQNGTLIAPGGVILSSEYQAGNPNYRDFSIEMLEPGDAFEHRWVFRNDATLSIPGDIEFGDGTRQSTASSPQGEYIYEFDGINTNLTITEVNFNLLYCDPVDGYLGSDTHNINLPAGTPGQRLVVVNISSNCTLNVNGVAQVTALSGPAEFIYSPTDGSWITLYGTVVGV